MSFKKLLTLMAIATSLTTAINEYEIAEFNALLIDVNDNLMDYISLAENNPDFILPSGVLEAYTQITTYTDESYTSLFTMIDFAQVTTAMELLPWYTSRIEPILSSYFKEHSITLTANPDTKKEDADTKTTSVAASSAEVTSTVIGSSVAKGSSSTKESSSKTSSASSVTSSVASKASSVVSSAASKASTSSSNSKGTGNILTIGMGTVMAGAAALLL